MPRPQSRPYSCAYERSLRPCLGTTSTPRRRAPFRQTLLLAEALEEVVEEASAALLALPGRSRRGRGRRGGRARGSAAGAGPRPRGRSPRRGHPRPTGAPSQGYGRARRGRATRRDTRGTRRRGSRCARSARGGTRRSGQRSGSPRSSRALKASVHGGESRDGRLAARELSERRHRAPVARWSPPRSSCCSKIGVGQLRAAVAAAGSGGRPPRPATSELVGLGRQLRVELAWPGRSLTDARRGRSRAA